MVPGVGYGGLSPQNVAYPCPTVKHTGQESGGELCEIFTVCRFSAVKTEDMQQRVGGSYGNIMLCHRPAIHEAHCVCSLVSCDGLLMAEVKSSM